MKLPIIVLIAALSLSACAAPTSSAIPLSTTAAPTAVVLPTAIPSPIPSPTPTPARLSFVYAVENDRLCLLKGETAK